jgi:hypothetical protein
MLQEHPKCEHRRLVGACRPLKQKRRGIAQEALDEDGIQAGESNVDAGDIYPAGH